MKRRRLKAKDGFFEQKDYDQDQDHDKIRLFFGLRWRGEPFKLAVKLLVFGCGNF
jgi:hypothetical protein